MFRVQVFVLLSMSQDIAARAASCPQHMLKQLIDSGDVLIPGLRSNHLLFLPTFESPFNLPHSRSRSSEGRGREFVSTIEGRVHPIYGVQWHPERPIFEPW